MGNEVCDEGASATSGCPECTFITEGWICYSEGQQCEEVCGNGVITENEVCDVGSHSTDGCDNC